MKPDKIAYSPGLRCRVGLNKWGGEIWLFRENKAGAWISVRVANEHDLKLFDGVSE